METAGIVFMSLAGGFVVLWAIILIVRAIVNRWFRPLRVFAPVPWVMWPPILTVIALIFGSAILAGEQPFWLFLLIPLQLLFPTAFILSLYFSTRNAPPPAGVSEFWNVDKVLGGSVFGDFANTVGVLAGVGAYQLSNQAQGWFWLGQFGAMLAILVGLSLAIRAGESGAGRINGEPAWESGMAIGNLSVGIFTFLSLMTPKDEASRPNVWFSLVWFFALFFFFVISIGSAFGWDAVIHSLNYPNIHLRRFVRFVIWVFRLLLLILPFTAGVFLIITITGTTYSSNFAYVFGLLAAISWTSIEIANIVKVWNDHSQIASLFRSLMIVFGNLALMYIISVVNVDGVRVFEPVHWILFGNALTLAGLATLMGIHLGIIKIEERRAAAAAAAANRDRVLADVRAAFSSSLSSDEISGGPGSSGPRRRSSSLSPPVVAAAISPISGPGVSASSSSEEHE